VPTGGREEQAVNKVEVDVPDDGTGAVKTTDKSGDGKKPGKVEKTKGGVRVTFAEKKPKSAKKAAKKTAKKSAKNPADKETAKKPQSPADLSPFIKPSESKSRLKIFIWGESGAGKTTFMLGFPGLAVIDCDNGTDPFKERFDFDIKKTVNVDEAKRMVGWLATHEHPYLTLGIDPITIIWESMQKKWSDIFLERNKRGKGHKHEFYEMQVRDWQTLKSDFKALIRMLLALDMNIVVTARAKVKYKDKDKSGEFMVQDGVTFDGDKSLPYMFDTVLHLEVKDNKRMLTCQKDRWEIFPTNKSVPLSMKYIEKIWKKMGLDAPSNQIILPPEEEVVSDRQIFHFASKEQQGQIVSLARELGFSEAQISEALAGREVASVDKLSEEQAEEMIESLNEVKAARISDKE